MGKGKQVWIKTINRKIINVGIKNQNEIYGNNGNYL